MRKYVWAVLGGLALMTGCDLNTPAGNAPVLNEPAVLEVIGGQDQVGRVNTRLPGAVIVRVSDTRKEGIVGVSVIFEVTAGEGSLDATTMKTDADGTARVEWTLGSETGAQQIEARVVNPKTGQVVLSARIAATATAP